MVSKLGICSQMVALATLRMKAVNSTLQNNSKPVLAGKCAGISRKCPPNVMCQRADASHQADAGFSLLFESTVLASLSAAFCHDFGVRLSCVHGTHGHTVCWDTAEIGHHIWLWSIMGEHVAHNSTYIQATTLDQRSRLLHTAFNRECKCC